MKSLGLFETKNRLSEICAEVAETGEPLVVTRRGKPLVRIVPESTQGKPESVWQTVKEARKKYGDLPDDLELPPRGPGANRPDPLAD